MSDSEQNQYSDAARRIYDRVVDWYIESFWEDTTDIDWIRIFLSSLEKSGVRICDMASGPGNFSRHLYPEVNAVTCVDISPKMIDAAMRLVPQVRGIVADMREVPLCEGSFEGILCAYSFNHIIEAEAKVALLEFNRLLVRGGILGIAVKEGEGHYEFTARRLPKVASVMQLWTEDKLVHNLSEAGFELKQVLKKMDIAPNEFVHGKLFVLAVKR